MQIGGKAGNKGEAALIKSLKWDLNLFIDGGEAVVRRRPLFARVALYVAALAVIAALCALPYVRLDALEAQRDTVVLQAQSYAEAGVDAEEAALDARLRSALAAEDALVKWRDAVPELQGVIDCVYGNRGDATIQKLTLEGGTLLIEGFAPKGNEAAALTERLGDAGVFLSVDIREVADGAAGYTFVLAATLK